MVKGDGYTLESAIIRRTYIDQILDDTTKHDYFFGNTFLDKATMGMINTDLCFIGAKSGKGKTQFLTNIANHNASLKKKVLFLGLEAEENEIEMRLKYEIESGLYFKDLNRNRTIRVDYRSWRRGLLQREFQKYKEEAISIFIDRFTFLDTVYTKSGFDVDALEKVLFHVPDADMIIIDHLHFFDIRQSAKSEHHETTFILKKIRELNLEYKKPFVVAAHVRKDLTRIIPDMEDFHGTSNIPKIATMIIMMAQAPNGYDHKAQMSKTYFTIPKLRTGSLGNICGILSYSLRHQQYIPDFSLGVYSHLGDKVNELEREGWPEWASGPVYSSSK